MDLIEYQLVGEYIDRLDTGLIDMVDRLNYIYTPVLFMMCSIAMLFKHIVSDPILCWAPTEFTPMWQSYVRSYCWVRPTYNLLPDGSLPSHAQRRFTQTNYYQWTVFVFLIQAALSWAPLGVWHQLLRRSGLNLPERVRHLTDVQKKDNCDDDEEDEIGRLISPECERELIEFADGLAGMLEAHITDDTFLDTDNVNGSCWSRMVHWLSVVRSWGPVRFFDLSRGNALPVYYVIFIKLSQFGVVVFQLFVMKELLNTGCHRGKCATILPWTFGIKIVENLFHGRTWRETRLFPRVVGCDVTVHSTGQPLQYSVQCVLPGNMLHEKFYLFLWFWLITCGVLVNLGSIVSWLFILSSKQKRIRYVKKLLKIYSLFENKSELTETLTVSGNSAETNSLLMNRITNEECPTETNLSPFVEAFLRLDGLFLLHMFSLHCHTLFTTRVLGRLFYTYTLRRQKLIDLQEIYGSD